MKCSQARSFLGAYLDSELEASATVEVNQHLDACPSCRRRFAAEQRIEAAVARELRAAGDDDDHVAGWIVASVTSGTGRGRRALLAISALAAAALVALWFGPWSTMPPVFVQAAAHDHQKFVAGAMEPDFATDTPTEVQAYLARELGIDAPLLQTSGDWRILGPRLCVLQSVTVGLVLLKRGSVPVSLFFLPAAEAKRLDDSLTAGRPISPRSFSVEEGNAVLAASGGTFRCAVGSVPVEELRNLVLARRE